MMRHNALTDPFIRTRMPSGTTRRLTLPHVCAALADDDVATFPALRPHQAPAWHAFLVQIAAMGMIRTKMTKLPADIESWTRLLRVLTPDWECDEPWCLVTPTDRPALLQAPLPDADPAAPEQILKTRESTPDGIDMLVTAKHHELKTARMHKAQSDDWLFALVSLQTQEGVMGAAGGNYGVARMNTGYGSRAYVRLRAPNASAGACFRRDLEVLTQSGKELSRAGALRGMATGPTTPLLWTEPWDGGKGSGLKPEHMHPLTVEICRRVRLFEDTNGLHARRTGSAARRVAAEHLHGNLGDPWTPIASNEDPPVSLSVSASGFHYQRAAELLFGIGTKGWSLPLLARAHGHEAHTDMELTCAAIARGQGKTDGFHQRIVPVPAKATGLLAAPETDAATRMARRAAQRIKMAADVRTKCLRPALIVLVQKGPQKPDWNKPSNGPLTDPWTNRFDRQIDDCFFPELWKTIDLDADEAALAWGQVLAGNARTIFAESIEQMPHTADRNQLAAARGRNLLEGALRKQLPRRDTKDNAA